MLLLNVHLLIVIIDTVLSSAMLKSLRYVLILQCTHSTTLAVTLQHATKENHYFAVKEDDPYSFTTMKMSGVKVKV